MPIEEVPMLSLGDKNRPIHWTKPPHPAMVSKNRPILLCYLKMLVGNIWIGNSNAKCKRKWQMQNANLKFLPELKILPKPKIFAQTYFAFRDQKNILFTHANIFVGPSLGGVQKKFIGLTLKCQLKRYLCCHLETKTAPFIGQNRPILLCYLKTAPSSYAI